MTKRLNLMMICPNTRRPVFTGRVVQVSSFDAAVIPGSSFRCGDCGEVHRWDKGMTRPVQSALPGLVRS